MPRTQSSNRQRPRGIGGLLARRLHIRSERGAALVEAAIVFPVLFTIILGSLEYGLMFKDSLTLSNATRAGVRAASIDGNNQFSDYDVLNAVTASLGAAGVGNTQYVIVYKATPATLGAAPLSAPPANCVTTGDGLASGTSGITNSCNIYSGAYLQTFTSANKSTFGTCPTVSTSPDHFWCPVGTTAATGRQVLQSGSSTADGGPDYIGVYVKVTHKALTGLVTNNKALSDNSVQRIEPH
jgi:Flp pilus assembly protein TadG